MNIPQFLDCTLSELENRTSVNRHRWSKYFNSRMAMREDVLIRTAIELEMSPVTLFQAIQDKKAKKLLPE